MIDQPRIVWVSNSDEIASVMDDFNKDNDYSFIHLNNFYDLETQLKMQTPDIIVLDYASPYSILDDLFQQVKLNKHMNNVPIVCTIPENSTEDSIRCLDAGATDYLIKPLNKWEIMARIKVNIRLKEYQEQLTKKHQELEEYSDMLLELNSKLESMARKDELTHLWNRRAFNEQIENIHNYSNRYCHKYCVLMADIDHFKYYNDHYGHQSGDEILKIVAQTLSTACRSTDFVARFGGEEFVLILPETDIKSGQLLAHRMLIKIRRLQIEHKYNDVADVLTISIGLAEFVPNGKDSEEWKDVLERADEALYDAKNFGRNQVCIK